MTLLKKKELITQIAQLLEQIIEAETSEPASCPTPLAGESLKMLTIKECAALVPGLTEHTVRMLVKQDKVKYIRCGEGARGKILVSKESLLKYLGAVCAKKIGQRPIPTGRAKPDQKGCRGTLPQRLLSLRFRSDKSIFALIVTYPFCE